MALMSFRATFARVGGMNGLLGKQMHPLSKSRMAAATPIQVANQANLTATYGEKYPYAEPWKNWESRKYTIMHEFFDSTSARLNENSKVIIVDGNVGVGKNEFARRLAAGFDLKCIESIPDSECFKTGEANYDLRELNYLLPETAQFYDLQKFLADPNPECGKVGRLQLQMFHAKFMAYAHGLHHLLSTGQGFVMVRSPFTDDVFVDSLRRMGYVTPNFVQYYNELRSNAICELLRPHVSIYLDAPVNILQERIKKRADAREVNSKVLSDKYLSTLETVYKQSALTRLRESGHVVEIDWTEVADELEMDVIIEELQRMQLEPVDNDDTRCQDWNNHSEDMYCHFRKYFGSQSQMMGLFKKTYHWDCPEIGYTEEDANAFQSVVAKHPAVCDKIGESERLGQRNLWGFF